jgi:hypothetical protein
MTFPDIGTHPAKAQTVDQLMSLKAEKSGEWLCAILL